MRQAMPTRSGGGHSAATGAGEKGSAVGRSTTVRWASTASTRRMRSRAGGPASEGDGVARAKVGIAEGAVRQRVASR